MGPKIVGQGIELSRAGMSGGMHEAHAVEATAALLSFKDHKNGCQQAATEPTEVGDGSGHSAGILRLRVPSAASEDPSARQVRGLRAEYRGSGSYPSRQAA